MHKNLLDFYGVKLSNCKKSLENHQFACDVFETKEDALAYLQTNIAEGSSIAMGGSMTLEECGVNAWLESSGDKFTYYDRKNCQDPEDVYRAAFSCDVYLTSSNAITMDGQLYNVDGRSNRVAALTFGPKKVYVMAGINKVVADIDEAVKRVETIAAPANCMRLNKNNPCTTTSQCVHCNVATTICNTYVTTRRSATPERIHVLLVKESLGY